MFGPPPEAFEGRQRMGGHRKSTAAYRKTQKQTNTNIHREFTASAVSRDIDVTNRQMQVLHNTGGSRKIPYKREFSVFSQLQGLEFFARYPPQQAEPAGLRPHTSPLTGKVPISVDVQGNHKEEPRPYMHSQRTGGHRTGQV